MFVEVSGGLITNSLALLADAGHILTDLGTISLALVALWFAERPISAVRTFGTYCIESFAALANGLLLCLVALWVAAEAYQRLLAPPEVKSAVMLVVAILGLGANILAGFLLHQ